MSLFVTPGVLNSRVAGRTTPDGSVAPLAARRRPPRVGDIVEGRVVACRESDLIFRIETVNHVFTAPLDFNGRVARESLRADAVDTLDIAAAFPVGTPVAADVVAINAGPFVECSAIDHYAEEEKGEGEAGEKEGA